MKHITLWNIAARLLVTVAMVAGPFAAFAADQKMADSAQMEPVKSVYDHYLAIQKELTKDSLKGVDQHAGAIAKAVRGDEMKMLPSEVAKQADNLAAANDIKKAREAFKPLSASLA